MANLLKNALAFGLTGAADAWSDNLGYQGGNTMALRQKIAQAEDEEQEAARRQAMQRAIMGAVNEFDPSHLSQSVNPIMGRPTPGLANNPRNAPNIAAARVLAGNPDTMEMGLQLAMRQPERPDYPDAVKQALFEAGGDPIKAQQILAERATQKRDEPAPLEIERLIKLRDKLAPDDPSRRLYDAAINKVAGVQSAEDSADKFRFLTNEEKQNRGLNVDTAYQISLFGADKGKVTKADEPNATLKARDEGLKELEGALTDFGDMLEDYGNETTLPMFRDPERLGNLNGARARIMSAVKKADTLGTLDAGLITFFNMMLADPTGWDAFLRAPPEMVKGQLRQMYNKLGKDAPDFTARLADKRKRAGTPNLFESWNVDQERNILGARVTRIE